MASEASVQGVRDSCFFFKSIDDAVGPGPAMLALAPPLQGR